MLHADNFFPYSMEQKIEQSTDVLKEIISPAIHEGDVKWPPRDPDTLKLMEKEISRREQEGQLDEGFLSEVSAQLRLNKMEINQGFKLCCKRCCSYTRPHLSKSGVRLTKHMRMSGTRCYLMDLQLEKEMFHPTNFMLLFVRELRGS